jgi:hypothetical protein
MPDVGVLQDTNQTSFLYKNKRAQRKLSVGGSIPLSVLKPGKCYRPACVHARPSFLGAKLNLHWRREKKIMQPGLNKLTGGPSYMKRSHGGAAIESIPFSGSAPHPTLALPKARGGR